jgi:hypothetical protein
MALCLADLFAEKFGGDSMDEFLGNLRSFRGRVDAY